MALRNDETHIQFLEREFGSDSEDNDRPLAQFITAPGAPRPRLHRVTVNNWNTLEGDINGTRVTCLLGPAVTAQAAEVADPNLEDDLDDEQPRVVGGARNVRPRIDDADPQERRG
jgi:hypothetical protein